MSKKIIKDLDTGQIFDSLDELYISWYLQELKDNGYIDSFEYEPESFMLAEGLKGRKVEYEQLQTKVKKSTPLCSLLKGHKYTPDFKVNWNIKAENIFYTDHVNISVNPPFKVYNSQTSILEIKPNSKKHVGSKAKTNISRKMVLEKYGIYVEEILYETLFYPTFFPQRYITKDNKRMSQIRHSTKFKMASLSEYLNNKKNNLEKFNNLKQKYNEQ